MAQSWCQTIVSDILSTCTVLTVYFNFLFKFRNSCNGIFLVMVFKSKKTIVLQSTCNSLPSNFCLDKKSTSRNVRFENTHHLLSPKLRHYIKQITQNKLVSQNRAFNQICSIPLRCSHYKRIVEY